MAHEQAEMKQKPYGWYDHSRAGNAWFTRPPAVFSMDIIHLTCINDIFANDSRSRVLRSPKSEKNVQKPVRLKLFPQDWELSCGFLAMSSSSIRQLFSRHKPSFLAISDTHTHSRIHSNSCLVPAFPDCPTSLAKDDALFFPKALETRTAGFKRCDYLGVTNCSFPFIFCFRWMDRPTDRHFDVIFELSLTVTWCMSNFVIIGTSERTFFVVRK